jgi:hypothetical protein
VLGIKNTGCKVTHFSKKQTKKSDFYEKKVAPLERLFDVFGFFWDYQAKSG